MTGIDSQRRKVLTMAGMASSTSLVGCLGSFGGTDRKSELVAATSSEGTMGYVAHQGFAQVLSENVEDLSLRVQPGSATEGASRLTLRGDADIGVSTSLIIKAAHDRTNFREFDFSDIETQVLQVFPWAHLNMFHHTYKGRDIPDLSCESITDKFFSQGSPALSPTFLAAARTADVPLECAEVRDSDLANIAQQLKNGVIDITLGYTVTKTGIPGWWQELANDEDIRITPYTDEQEQNIEDDPIMIRSTISAEDRFGFKPGGVDEITVADFPFHTIATPRLSEATIYTMVEGLFSNIEQVQEFHSGLSEFSAEWCVDSLMNDVPVHPGAAKYFKEAGVWDSSLTVGETE